MRGGGRNFERKKRRKLGRKGSNVEKIRVIGIKFFLFLGYCFSYLEKDDELKLIFRKGLCLQEWLEELYEYYSQFYLNDIKL
jgi:hypothetical protein